MLDASELFGEVGTSVVLVEVVVVVVFGVVVVEVVVGVS